MMMGGGGQVPLTNIANKKNLKKAVVKAPNLLADVELNPQGKITLNKIATS